MPRYSDVYLVDVEKGERVLVLEKSPGPVSLSPTSVTWSGTTAGSGRTSRWT